MSPTQLKLKVICSQLPGLRFEDPYKHEPRVKEPVYLGIQRGTEVIEQVPADRCQVVFDPEFRIGTKPDGSPNFLGPYAQGRPGDRFFYLSWGIKRSDRFNMFRRLKIRLSHLEWPEIDTALETGEPIVVRLKLTDDLGGPACGTPDESRIAWEP